MELSKKSIMHTIKKEIGRLTHQTVDFRMHNYLENNYGLSPIFNYDFAKTAVQAMYSELEYILEEYPEYFPEFSGFEYNTEMELNKLRTGSLKSFIESKIDELLSFNVKPNFKIISSTFEPDIGSEVCAKLNGNLAEFTVQLTGGEHLTQMGCLLLGEDEHPDFKKYFNAIISAGEQCCAEHVAEQVEEGKWETIMDTSIHVVSATSYTKELLQKRINFDENVNDYQFRVIPDNTGFTQPNDYSAMPDFIVKEFCSIESAKEYLAMDLDERSYTHGVN